MDPKLCAEREKNCTRRQDCLEGKYFGLTKDPDGTLPKLHEKVNSGFANRPTWKVFFIIVSILFSLICGAYGYSKSISEEQKNLVTKEDFREFRKEILEEIRKTR